MRKYFLLVFLYFSFCDALSAQFKDRLMDDSVAALRLKAKPRLKIKEFIFPAAAMAYGALATPKGPLHGLNHSTSSELLEDHPFFRSGVDNFAQYAPAATVLALQAIGIKGKNDFKNEAIIGGMSLAIMTAIVYPAKKIVREMRPDSSSRTSFPSGHTATAFATAEFLRKEYGQVSPWYGIGGYAVAAGTGLFRMLNNRHWLGDVVAGAGIGIASTKLAYFIHDRIKWNRFNKSGITALPFYYKGTIGFTFSKHF